MRRTALTSLLMSFVLIAGSPPARAEKLDPALFQDLLKTARAYAADRTLIFYCLRKSDEMMPFLYAGVHLDIAYALQLLRASGADERQRAELIEAVLRNVRSAPRDEDDPQRNTNCAAAEVEKSLAVLKGVGAPLFQRPPFERLRP